MKGLREELREVGDRESRALEGGGAASLKVLVTIHGTRGPVRQVRMAPRVLSLRCSGLLPEVHQSWFDSQVWTTWKEGAPSPQNGGPGPLGHR